MAEEKETKVCKYCKSEIPKKAMPEEAGRDWKMDCDSSHCDHCHCRNQRGWG